MIEFLEEKVTQKIKSIPLGLVSNLYNPYPIVNEPAVPKIKVVGLNSLSLSFKLSMCSDIFFWTEKFIQSKRWWSFIGSKFCPQNPSNSNSN